MPCRTLARYASGRRLSHDGWGLECGGLTLLEATEGSLRRTLFPTAKEQKGWVGTARVQVVAEGRKPPELPAALGGPEARMLTFLKETILSKYRPFWL